MKITHFDHYAGLSACAADLFVAQLRKRKDALVCCATGGSPQGLYQRGCLELYSEDEADLFDFAANSQIG